MPYPRHNGKHTGRPPIKACQFWDFILQYRLENPGSGFALMERSLLEFCKRHGLEPPSRPYVTKMLTRMKRMGLLPPGEVPRCDAGGRPPKSIDHLKDAILRFCIPRNPEESVTTPVIINQIRRLGMKVTTYSIRRALKELVEAATLSVEKVGGRGDPNSYRLYRRRSP